VAAIRPILEYCSSLWAHNLPTYLSDQIESIQERGIRIIHNPTIGMPYISALTYADLESLKHRRKTQARELFQKILSPTSCLHSILPPPRDDAVQTRLRKLITENKKYHSFISFGLKKLSMKRIKHSYILHDCTECSQCHCHMLLLLHLCIECCDSHVLFFYSAPQCSHCKRCISYTAIPSVRLSVTRRYCVKTTARSTVQFALLDSKMCLVL